MKSGIQIVGNLNIKQVCESAFEFIEIWSEDIESYEMSLNKTVGSVVIKANQIEVHDTLELLSKMCEKKIKYLVVNTADYPRDKKEELYNQLVLIAKKLGDLQGDIKVLIENGYDQISNKYVDNGITYAEDVKELVYELNKSVNGDVFAIAYNMGHANLFALNVAGYLELLGEDLRLVHLNDNDGIIDFHQIPYTFTKGRGDLATDWYGIAKSLIKMNYDGLIIFDLNGYFSAVPKEIIPAALDMLIGILKEWEEYKNFEQVLNQPGKQIILFGAGNMFQNYMDSWGNQYPPSFLVDNNSSTWGTTRRGIEIKDPREICNIPEDERIVLICNMYYKQIKNQLINMGIKAGRYDDRYL